MDHILAMAKARPDSPEFRQALITRLGDAAIKSGEAFDSNGPDFIWAVEAQSRPTLVAYTRDEVAVEGRSVVF